MRNECTDPDLGKLLHAYELGFLSEKDQIRFETHLLGCESCYSLAAKFVDAGRLLRSHDSVEREVRTIVGEASASGTGRSGLWRYLWPDAPVVFRPAVLFLVALLLLYPAYRGMFAPPRQGVDAVQSVNLFPARSGLVEEITLLPGVDVVLAFVYEDCVLGQIYSVKLVDESATVIHQQESFSGFDRFCTGRLLISAKTLRRGKYRLTVGDPTGDSIDTQEYRMVVDFRTDKQ